MVAEKTRKKIIDAFMALAAERSWEDVSMAAVAERAGVTVANLRVAYDSRVAMLEDFFRRIDAQVLDGVDDDLANEPAQDRLFDVLMSRLDALASHKHALRAVADEAWRNPLLAAELNRISFRSHAWMLSAAGVNASGLRGVARTQGLVIAFARVLGVWFDDEDLGQARTMATLDKELKRGAAMLGQLDRAGAFIGSLRRFSQRTRGRDTDSDRDASGGNAEKAKTA